MFTTTPRPRFTMSWASACEQHGSKEVDAEHRAPGLRRYVQDRNPRKNTGIVDEAKYPIEMPDGLFGTLGDLPGDQDIDDT